MNETVESLIAYSRENSRICPMPDEWNALWELLPERGRVGGGWEPPLPLILAAWHDTPGLLKMLRAARHIEWAAEHGALERVAAFLRDLREDQWFHGDDESLPAVKDRLNRPAPDPDETDLPVDAGELAEAEAIQRAFVYRPPTAPADPPPADPTRT